VPVYLFSYHAYRSWMPDNPRGYTKRGMGYQPSDEDIAEQYRINAKSDGILFDETLQRALLEEGLTACEFQGLRLHGAATEPSHAHYLVSLEDGEALDEGACCPEVIAVAETRNRRRENQR
jgi:hypothetical protein